MCKKDFYQTSKTDYIDLSKISLKPTYEYYISLKTSTQSYVFTNFFVSQASQAITVKVLKFVLYKVFVTTEQLFTHCGWVFKTIVIKGQINWYLCAIYLCKLQ